MEDTVYLTVDDTGIKKLTHTHPRKMGVRQFAIPVTITLPDELWEKHDKLLDEILIEPEVEPMKRGLIGRAELAAMADVCFGPPVAFEHTTSYGTTVNYRCASCGFENYNKWERNEPHYVPADEEVDA